MIFCLEYRKIEGLYKIWLVFFHFQPLIFCKKFQLINYFAEINCILIWLIKFNLFKLYNLFYNTKNHQINQKIINWKSEIWISIFSCIRIEITETKISLQNTELKLTNKHHKLQRKCCIIYIRKFGIKDPLGGLS